MDMYIEAPDDLGGYVRMYEVAELIRRGAPLYLKFGLSKAPGIYPYGHHMRELTLATAKERVRRGRLALDLLARHGADGDMAPLGSRLPGHAATVRNLVITFRKLPSQKKTQPSTIRHTSRSTRTTLEASSHRPTEPCTTHQG